MRRPFQHWTRFCEFKPRQVARYKCFAEGKTLAGLHIAAIEAVICSGNRFSLTQQSTGLLLPASAPLRVCEVRSSFRFPPQVLLQKNKRRHPASLIFWSRVRESNPPPRLGKPMYYRCTNPAHLLPADYIKLPAVLQPLFSSNPENIYAPPRPGWAVPVRAAYIQMT